MAAIGVSQIIKEAITEMKVRGLSFTPENYSEVFNEIASKRGFTTEESVRLSRYISRLSDDYRKQAQVAHIKSIDEFIAFVISRLNINTNKVVQNLCEHENRTIKSYDAYAKRILQAVGALHNEKAQKLAKANLLNLSKKIDENTIDGMREQWFEFISNYDDSFLGFLKYYGVKKFDDLATMMKELEGFLSVNDDNLYINIANLLFTMLTPTLSKELDEELKRIKERIKKEPACLNTDEIQESLRRIFSRRAELDRAEISEKITSLNGLLESINEKVVSLANSSHQSNAKMQGIKSDLNHIDITAEAFEEIRLKLIDIADMLESETKELGTHMDDNQASISRLQDHIRMLEAELAQARAESNEDFLTKTATKRALMQELLNIEESYKRYGTDYSLCFLDIDHFKKINDTYGHDAGDVILSAVAKIFRKYSRKMDFVGRYGGEEFIILLPNTTLKDAVKFADKLRSIIENFKFVYKDERIDVKLSCGVANRSANISDTATLENADKMLYAAKENGRNQVMPQIINGL